MKTPVIVLGGNLIGLGIARSLGKAGIPVIMLRYNPNDVGHVSKYVKHSHVIADPNTDEKQYIKDICSFAKKYSGALLVPVNDDTLLAITRNARILKKYYTIAAPAYRHAQLFLDKKKTYALCEKKKVPSPWTYTPQSRRALERIKNKITYPCILKPSLSHPFVAEFNAKFFKANNYTELVKHWERCKHHSIMMQEYIDGDDANHFGVSMYYTKKGTCAYSIHTQKIRQNPPRAGVGRIARHTIKKPLLEKYAKALMRGLKFNGKLSFDFKYDKKNKKYKLIEVNARFNRFHALFIASGVDFPRMMYNDMVLNKPTPVRLAKPGTYWIDMYADIVNTLFRDTHEAWGYTEYLAPYKGKRKVFANLSASDPIPFMYMLATLPRKYSYHLKEKVMRWMQ